MSDRSVSPTQEQIAELAQSTLHSFGDWPNREIPRVCAGVYAVYDRDERFIYAGMAGASLTEAVIRQKEAEGKKSGLFDRLNSHASGYRSGDRFNIYIGDLYVLPTLSRGEIKLISRGEWSFDASIKHLIRDELSYRYLVTANTVVRELESDMQRYGIDGVLPAIDARR